MTRHPSRRSVLVAGLLGGGATCVGSAKPAAANEQPVRIGLLASMTGASATAGARIVAGAEIAAEAINALGGIGGQKLQLLVEDTESNPKAGMDAIHKLIDVARLPIVLGENSSSVTVPTATYANSKSTVQINIAATATGLRKIGPFVFSMLPTDDILARDLVEFAMEDSQEKDFGILITNDAFGISMSTEIKSAIAARGGRVAAEVLYEPKRTDYRAELQRLFSANPRVVMSMAFFETSRIIQKQAYELGLYARVKGKWYAPYVNLAAEPAIPETVEDFKGLINEGASNPAVVAFTEKYRKKSGDAAATTAPVYALLAYDAVWVAALAHALAGSRDAARLRAALPTAFSVYRGLSNEDKSVDADGIPVRQKFARKVFRGGKLVSYPS